MQEQPTADELKANVQNTNVWVRLFFMALFAILYWGAEVVLIIVVLFQFLSVLLTGEKNDRVLAFGAQLSSYAYQIFRFLTFNSEEKPFPLGDWPSDDELLAVTAPAATKTAAEEKAEAEKAAKPKRAPRKPATKKTAAKKTETKEAEEAKPATDLGTE